MKGADSGNAEHMALLSRFMFPGYDGDFSNPTSTVERLSSDLEQVSETTEDEFRALLELADKHHVTVRAFRVLEKLAEVPQATQLQEWCRVAIKSETTRISNAIEWLYA